MGGARGVRIGAAALVLLACAGGAARAAGPAALPAASAPAGGAQDESAGFERVEVRVTAASERSVYLDAGTAAGLAPGDRVRLMPTGASSVEATIQAVSTGSARAELDAPVELRPGDRGEVLVPRARLVEEPAAATEAPDHPPWPEADGTWTQDMPLLAPAVRGAARERAVHWRGRLWAGFDTTEDRDGSESTYSALRGGLDVAAENLLGRGGELVLDVEAFQREVDTDDEGSDDHGRLRVDRFSYRVGGTREAPTRWEVGRFLHHEFPELGIVDGVEVAHRLESGDRVGASAGFLPEPDDDLGTAEDLAVSAFYRWVLGPLEESSLGLAYQKSWHEGEADRDLVVATADVQASEDVFLYGAAWVDVYGSDAAAKDSGPELTRLTLDARWRVDEVTGLSAFHSRYRWPELLRDELPGDPSPELYADGEVVRTGLGGWRELGEHLRLDARASVWEDEEDDGASLELDASVRDLLWDRGALSVGVFHSGGAFSDALGLRLAADKRLDTSFLRVSWDVTDQEQEDFSGDQEELRNHVLRASWDGSVGAHWDLSLFGERRLGDEQDAYSLGILVQRRF